MAEPLQTSYNAPTGQPLSTSYEPPTGQAVAQPAQAAEEQFIDLETTMLTPEAEDPVETDGNRDARISAGVVSAREQQLADALVAMQNEQSQFTGWVTQIKDGKPQARILIVTRNFLMTTKKSNSMIKGRSNLVISKQEHLFSLQQVRHLPTDPTAAPPPAHSPPALAALAALAQVDVVAGTNKASLKFLDMLLELESPSKLQEILNVLQVGRTRRIPAEF